MATMVMDMTQKAKVSFFCLSLLSAPLAYAGEWNFDPSLKVNETYTDNVGLSSLRTQSSLVSQTGVALESTYKAKQLSFNLASDSTYAFYSHDHELDNDYHTLSSDIAYQLWPNGIKLIASADIRNSARNSSRNSLADIVSADTVRVENYQGGLSYDILNSDFLINSSVLYNLDQSEDNIGDREGYGFVFTSQNGTSARHIFWNAQHKYQTLENNGLEGKISESEVKVGLISEYHINPFVRYYHEENSGNINNSQNNAKFNSYGAGIRWLISPRLFIDISYNKPTGSALNIDGKEQKNYVDTYIKWQPSSRTTLSTNFSERFYGNSYGLELTHRNKRLTNSISYIEDVQTLTRDNYNPVLIGQFWCPPGLVDDLSKCLVSNDTTIVPGDYVLNQISEFELVEDNTFSLNKTLQWTSTFTLPRTVFEFSAYRNSRENLDSRIEDKNMNASFSISRKVSGNSNINVDLSYNETNFRIGTLEERQDRYRRYQIGYDKKLNSSLSFGIDLSYLDRGSDNATLDYDESRISAQITKGF